MTKEKPREIELTLEEIEALRERLRRESLAKPDYGLLDAIIVNYFAFEQGYQEQGHTLRRMAKLIFGPRTEKAKEVLKDASPEQPLSRPIEKPESQSPAEKARGHGRNGSSSYQGVERISVLHPCYKTGDPCPLCCNGKLYQLREPAVVVRVRGRSPLEAKVYDVEKLRCHLCGKIFTAPLPEKAGKDKYDETAGAMVALLKYGSGLPFNRLEKLQESLGVPLPASTQWEIVEGTADKIHPVYRELIRQAAQGELFYNDDTTMKILANLQKPQEGRGDDEKARKGSFTTGVLAVQGQYHIALFFTGSKHAGDNLAQLLEQRAPTLRPPIQMCDALSRNLPKGFVTVLANCLAHARRNFVDLVPSFPEECRVVIEHLAEVYHHDEEIKKQALSAEQRLRFHQDQSGPVMEKLKEWLKQQINQRRVEPNSSMGKAIAYMLNHWEPLTLFLRVPGAPLDNSLCEQILKRAIQHRKNSLFFRTQHGAYIGDLFMSLIHTCTLNRVNPFHYLVTLQKHCSELFKDPKRWLPWNYEQAAANLA
jgi:transposase